MTIATAPTHGLSKSDRRHPRPRSTHLSVLATFLFFATLAGCITDFANPAPAGSDGGICGNDSIEAGETCDGENLAGRTCEDEGFGGGSISCRNNCTLDVSGCEDGCGNGVLDANEECDDGTENTDHLPDMCRRDCREPHCGDGVADTPETCDGTDTKGATCASVGMGSGNLSCMDDCHGLDTRSCSEPIQCGNNLREPGEACDGPALAGQTCETLGFVRGTLACTSDCNGFDFTACRQADGGPCTFDDQCESGECRTENGDGYPGGYCYRQCTDTAQCDPGSVCDDVFSECIQPCTDSSDCRLGYACFAYSNRPLPACEPHCENDSQCTDTLQCNPWTNECEPLSGGLGNGEACTSASECESRRSFGDETGWWCYSLCSVFTGVCPGDDVCVAAAQGADLGSCYRKCTDQGDCANGLTCEPAGTNMVCR